MLAIDTKEYEIIGIGTNTPPSFNASNAPLYEPRNFIIHKAHEGVVQLSCFDIFRLIQRFI